MTALSSEFRSYVYASVQVDMDPNMIGYDNISLDIWPSDLKNYIALWKVFSQAIKQCEIPKVNIFVFATEKEADMDMDMANVPNFSNVSQRSWSVTW